MKRLVALKYIASVAAVSGVVLLGYGHLPFWPEVERVACLFVACLSASCGAALGLGIGRWDTLLINENYSFVIVLYCTGLDYVVISLAAVWCARADLAQRIRLSFLAVLLVFVVNQARIQSIFWGATVSRTRADFLDYTFWPCVGWVILGLWIVMCLRVHLRHAVDAPLPTSNVACAAPH